MTETTRMPKRRTLRAAARRDRLRRQRRSMIVATLGVLGATVLGVSAAGSTYAFLTASATSPGGRVTAGTAGLQINGASTATFSAAALNPGTESRVAFTVTNTGDVPLQVSATMAVTTTPAPGIASSTTVLVAQVANAAACTAGPAGARSALMPSYSSAGVSTVAPGSANSQTYCLVIGVPAGTSATLSGQSFTYGLTLTGRQRVS